MEDRAFHEIFGTTALLCGRSGESCPSRVWSRLKEWQNTFYFMRAYPKQSITCAVVGGLAGAIDPKTLRKFIWPFIEAIAELTSDVVSLLCMLFGRKLHPTSQTIHFFVLDCFWEQEKEWQCQRLPHQHWQHRLPHPPARSGCKRELIFLAQICRKMRAPLRAWGGHNWREFSVAWRSFSCG